MAEKDLNSLMMMLGRMEEKIDSAHDKLDEYFKVHKTAEERITSLEHFRTGLMAKVSIVVILIGAAWSVIIKKML